MMITSIRSWLSKCCGHLLTRRVKRYIRNSRAKEAFYDTWRASQMSFCDIHLHRCRHHTSILCHIRWRLRINARQIDGLVQRRRHTSALEIKLRLSCTNPSKWSGTLPEIRGGFHEWMMVQHNEAEVSRPSLRSYYQCLYFTASHQMPQMIGGATNKLYQHFVFVFFVWSK